MQKVIFLQEVNLFDLEALTQRHISELSETHFVKFIEYELIANEYNAMILFNEKPKPPKYSNDEIIDYLLKTDKI